MSTKKWEKPQLNVLTRQNPEEMVLGSCKMAGSAAHVSDKKVGCANNMCPICSLNIKS
jgi:hypothetical protein